MVRHSAGPWPTPRSAGALHLLVRPGGDREAAAPGAFPFDPLAGDRPGPVHRVLACDVGKDGQEEPEDPDQEPEVIPHRRHEAASAVHDHIRVAREDRELVLEVLVVAHVPLVAEQQALTLHELHDGWQPLWRHVGPAVCSLEEVGPNSAPEPEQTLCAGGAAENYSNLDDRAEEVNMRDVREPRDADDRRGVVVMVLESTRQSADAWQVKRCIIQDKMDDTARHVHVEKARETDR
mmetsp:Transcript_99219/g.266571  ORF Transcript_99219/g.266571 Transcript_99219/m.266571 type:complete len:236 (+) Transcript_99219:141-848(+)